MINIIAAASNGTTLPDGTSLSKPIHVIYQCSEDGINDTIKPRLAAAGADCDKVAFLNEENEWITLGDTRIRRAIADFNAKLLVIDPIQAYLGDTDLSSASSMRRMLRQLAGWASMHECAIVLIGHLNKSQSSKDLYRALGSIDLVAAARSVIEVDRSEKDRNILMLKHLKCSLSSKAADMYFTITDSRRIEWLDYCPGSETFNDERMPSEKQSKLDQAISFMRELLDEGPVRSSEMLNHLSGSSFSSRIVFSAKKALGIESVKRDNVWYWRLP